ncbi:MAG: sensor histidine kinase [Saprospiraceae bacterium]
MWFKDFYFKKRRYILVYCLIWFVGIFFIGQRQANRSLVETLQWILIVMMVDAPVVFFTVFYVFQKYFTPKKIIQFAILIGLGNLITVFVYYGLNDFFGVGKFSFPNFEKDWTTIFFQIQQQTFTEIFHTVFISSLLLGIQYYDFKRKYLELENEKVQAELQLLKAQINPHFLFNNLNVLSSLIKKDTEAADEFITRFSKLYRYLLKSKNKDFVSLSEELDFLNDYVFLLKKRFGEAYQINQNLGKGEEFQYSILPSSLQGLIENAVKHNEGFHAAPLKIEMNIEGDFLIVKNEIRPKFDPVESIGSGLQNLNMRYQMLTNTSIKILEENGKFEVRIPLIKTVL